jgi:hypothetical protein
LLQQKADGAGNSISFSLDGVFLSFFLLKLDEYTWLRNLENGSDICVPLTRVGQHGSTQDVDKAEAKKVEDKKSSQADGLISDT